jgi:hypothetical protein
MMRILFLHFACLFGLAANAGTIYKCTDGGKVSYGDRPCPGAGKAMAVPDAPPPDTALQERIERSRATLAQLEQDKLVEAEREQREQVRGARAAVAERRRCDKLRLQRQWAEEDLARQRGDAKETARRKAQRQAETLALECPA